MDRLLLAQLGYAATGTAFNLVSAARIGRGEPGLTPTPPWPGVAVMATYAAAVCAGWAGFWLVYAIAMATAIIGLGSGGVVKHVQALPPYTGYASESARGVAIAVNSVGVLLSLIGFFAVL